MCLELKLSAIRPSTSNLVVQNGLRIQEVYSELELSTSKLRSRGEIGPAHPTEAQQVHGSQVSETYL